MVGKQAPAGKQGTAVHGSQTWLRPPHSVVEKIEALLELGKSTSAIRNHHTMVDYEISEAQIDDIRRDFEAARDWEIKKRSERKKQEEAAKSESSLSPPKTPLASSRSPKTPPSKSSKNLGVAYHLQGDSADDSGQILRGGPKTWPPEVVEHVQSLLELGWSSLKVSNHYSLIVFGLTAQQIDLVKALPATKKPQPMEAQRSDGLSDEQVERVRKLILEGKTDTAILNHYCLANTTARVDHIQSVRTAMEKEAWFVSSGGAVTSPLKKSATKIKPPQLSKQEKDLMHALISEGRSNAYICNYHAFCDLHLQEYHVEGVRRAFYDEQDGIAVVAARHSPPPKSSGFPGARSPDEDERLKKEHQARLRRRTAEKMQQQRMLTTTPQRMLNN